MRQNLDFSAKVIAILAEIVCDGRIFVTFDDSISISETEKYSPKFAKIRVLFLMVKERFFVLFGTFLSRKKGAYFDGFKFCFRCSK